ncbi:hypothetical protein TK34_14540 [Aeromonas hydrophila]|nr:hypothetical protein TK34_14540 [Aeromonas hydrophila]
MMEALKVMTYFKVSLSTHNWDRAKKKTPHEAGFKVMKNKNRQYTHTTKAHTHSQPFPSPMAIALGKGGSCDPPCVMD